MKSPEEWDREGYCFASVAKKIQRDVLAGLQICGHHTEEDRQNFFFQCPLCNTAQDKHRIAELERQCDEDKHRIAELERQRDDRARGEREYCEALDRAHEKIKSLSSL